MSIKEDIFSIWEYCQCPLQSSSDTIETFEKDMTSTLGKMVTKSVNGIGKAIPSMSKEDRVEIVRRLEEQGFFLIKGAIKVLAGKFNMSKFTIYNYLDGIRTENNSRI